MKNFVVYKAGAGSGKTFTLVREFLRLALHDETRLGQNYRQILAITFTNKAAAEMKSRVVQALDQIAGDQDTAMGRQLAGILKVSAEELRRRARVVLTHLLHHYSDFSVGTIDSFTHKIVRTFAQELDLPVNFNVEVDAAAFYEKVIAQLFASVGEDPMVSRLLKEYVLHRAEDNASWDPENSIREFTGLLLRENSGRYLAQLAQLSDSDLEAIHREFTGFISAHRSHLRQEGQKALSLVRGMDASAFWYGGSGPINFFKKCAHGQCDASDAGGSRLTKAIASDKWFTDAGPPGVSKQLSELAKGLVAYILENHAKFRLFTALSRQMHALMLLRKIDALSTQQKEEERVVFISEFNARIHELIRSEPAPFIYERLGERYHHFLLDEFQDTSSLQWLNLLPLLDNALGSGWYNLVVGDGKQSIYRWRNANVRQFALLPDLEPSADAAQQERAAALARNYTSETLSVNYRSAPAIVAFNNALFAELGKIAEGDAPLIYAGHAQTTGREEGGYVTVDTGACEPDELEQHHLQCTLKYISEALEDSYNYRDVCVLCRFNHHGSLVAEKLVENGIPVVSNESLLLRNNAEVNAVIAYLRTVLNPRDKVSAAAVCAYLLTSGHINGDTLDRLLTRVTSGEPLLRLLTGATGIEFATNRAATIADHCVQVISALGMERRAPQYVRFLLDEVHQFMVKSSPSIGPFLDWWETRSTKASLILPADTDAVRIMTIHSAKGLEFPVVIVPFCNWTIHRAEDAWVQVSDPSTRLPVSIVKLTSSLDEAGFGAEFEQEKSDQVLDNINLLYVAFTRAAERMHIVCNRSEKNPFLLAGDWVTGYLRAAYGERPDGHYASGSKAVKTTPSHGSVMPVTAIGAYTFPADATTIRLKQGSAISPAGDALARGLLLHELLSRVIVADDVGAAVEAAVVSGEVPHDLKQEFRDRLQAVVRHPRLAEFYRPGTRSRHEAEIMTPEGHVLRPDKVVFLDSETVIIDYKTGAEKTSDHAKQLQKYADALSRMGHTRVRKLLVYIDEARVVEVN